MYSKCQQLMAMFAGTSFISLFIIKRLICYSHWHILMVFFRISRWISAFYF